MEDLILIVMTLITRYKFLPFVQNILQYAGLIPIIEAWCWQEGLVRRNRLLSVWQAIGLAHRQLLAEVGVLGFLKECFSLQEVNVGLVLVLLLGKFHGSNLMSTWQCQLQSNAITRLIREDYMGFKLLTFLFWFFLVVIIIALGSCLIGILAVHSVVNVLVCGCVLVRQLGLPQVFCIGLSRRWWINIVHFQLWNNVVVLLMVSTYFSRLRLLAEGAILWSVIAISSIASKAACVIHALACWEGLCLVWVLGMALLSLGLLSLFRAVVWWRFLLEILVQSLLSRLESLSRACIFGLRHDAKQLLQLVQFIQVLS